jgi:XTP/dITP diphosphohydrolase
MEEIKGELGDLMLHMIFYSKIASETNDFDVADVLNTVCDKLVERHPHIYGDVVAETEEAVKLNWEKIKLKGGRKSVLEGVPKSLPAMVKATRIQEKARGVGFDWDNKEQVFEKVKEEFSELHAEVEKNDVAAIEDEFGDVLFSMINYARFVGVDPEMALERTNKKFIKRFQYLEYESKKDGKEMGEMTLDEMDAYWNKAKKI